LVVHQVQHITQAKVNIYVYYKTPHTLLLQCHSHVHVSDSNIT